MGTTGSPAHLRHMTERIRPANRAETDWRAEAGWCVIVAKGWLERRTPEAADEERGRGVLAFG
jgi:hypothetical protein